MRFRNLALDFDGTISTDGSVHADVRAAITDARRRSIRVIIVTGRRIAHLRETAGDLSFVDGVVAENGAVLLFPGSGTATVLAEPPPVAFLSELRRRGIEHECGEVVVECAASDANAVLSIIREQQIPLVLLFNRDRVMVLPQGISKATGLKQLLSAMRASLHNTVSFGDAENDHALLLATELGVAVRWGSPSLIAVADDVVEGTGPDALATYVRQLSQVKRIPPALLRRRKLLLGTNVETGAPVHLTVKGRNILIVGDPRSGKSWIGGLLIEQLVMQQYSVCIIDPEGDYEGLETLPDVIAFGGDDPPPRARELTHALRHSDVSVLVNLSKMPLDAKRKYVRELLQMLLVLRQTTGLPHRIVLDEAHYFLGDDGHVPPLLDLNLAGYTLISYRGSRLERALISATEAVIVTRATDPSEVRSLLEAHGIRGPAGQWLTLLGGLNVEEAVIFPGIDETGSAPVKVRLAERGTYHVRHMQKYIDVPVADYHGFVFTKGGVPTGVAVKTLSGLADAIGSTSAATIDGHLRRYDFSRWIEDVYGDHQLASTIRKVEERYRLRCVPDVNGVISAAIRERYSVENAPAA